MVTLATWLRRLYRWREPTDDPAWHPTGYTYKFTGHDEALGVEAARMAERMAISRRRQEAQRARRTS